MEETERQREKWLDMLRAAAACAVVLLHTVTGVMDHHDMNGLEKERAVFLIIMDLATWSVPVFIMISGYLFLDPRRELTFSVMLTKYCKRIVLALFLFGVPYACLEQIATARAFRFGMLLDAVAMVARGQSWSHMWYLYLILLLYLLTPLLRLVLKRLPLWGVSCIVLFLAAGGVALPFAARLTGNMDLPRLPDDSVYLLYYLLGYLFVMRSVRKTGSPGPAVRAGRLIPAAVCAAALAALAIFSRLTGEYHVQMAYNYPLTVLLAVLIMWTGAEAEPLLRGRPGTCLRVLSAWSFAVYLIHPVFLNLFYKFLHITPLSFPLVLSLPVFWLGVLGLSVAGAWALNRIPLLRKYVL